MAWWKFESRPKSEEFRGIGLIYVTIAVAFTLLWITSKPPSFAFVAPAWWLAAILMFWRSRQAAAREKLQSQQRIPDSNT